MITLQSHISRDDFQSYLDTLTDISNSKGEEIWNHIRHDMITYDTTWKSVPSSLYKGVVKDTFKYMTSYTLSPKFLKTLKRWRNLKLSGKI